jgi:hypothetical protein
MRRFHLTYRPTDHSSNQHYLSHSLSFSLTHPFLCSARSLRYHSYRYEPSPWKAGSRAPLSARSALRQHTLFSLVLSKVRSTNAGMHRPYRGTLAAMLRACIHFVLSCAVEAYIVRLVDRVTGLHPPIALLSVVSRGSSLLSRLDRSQRSCYASSSQPPRGTASPQTLDQSTRSASGSTRSRRRRHLTARSQLYRREQGPSATAPTPQLL